MKWIESSCQRLLKNSKVVRSESGPCRQRFMKRKIRSNRLLSHISFKSAFIIAPRGAAWPRSLPTSISANQENSDGRPYSIRIKFVLGALYSTFRVTVSKYKYKVQSPKYK